MKRTQHLETPSADGSPTPPWIGSEALATVASEDPGRVGRRGGRRDHRSSVLGISALVAPFSWFLIRSRGGMVDAVAVGLPVIAVTVPLVLFVIAWRFRRTWPMLLGVSVLAVSVSATLIPRLPRDLPAPEDPTRVTIANVFRYNRTAAAAERSLLEGSTDLLAVIEVPNERFHRDITKAARALPHDVERGWASVWSRWELGEPDELAIPHADVLRLTVGRPASPFVLYLVHGDNPIGSWSFSDQRAMTDRLLDAIEAERLPVVLGGDLNISDRTSSYRAIESELRDAMRTGGFAESTYAGGAWQPALLRIDHLFVSSAWCASAPSTFEVPGSDHRGIRAEVGPCGNDLRTGSSSKEGA